MSAPSRRLPIIALLVNATVWGLSWWPMRQLGELGLHALWTTTIIFGVSLAFVLPAERIAARRARHTPPASEAAGIWILALASGITNAGFNWGILVGEVVRVVLLFYLMPVWSAIFARALLGEAITGQTVLRITVSLAGAALVLWKPGAGIPVPASLGDWLGLIGGVGFALTNVMLRRLAEIRATQRLAAMCTGSALIPGAVAVLATAAGVIAPPPRRRLHGFWALPRSRPRWCWPTWPCNTARPDYRRQSPRWSRCSKSWPPPCRRC
ncbi:MAG: DMT family transporter [Burkholderiaceae bacterium]